MSSGAGFQEGTTSKQDLIWIQDLEREGYITAKFRMGYRGESTTWVDSTIPNMIWDVHLPGDHMNVRAHVMNNRFYVDAEITWDGINSYAISNMTFIGTMPANWDRNCNSNAFEIVGPDHLPVFQEIYTLPEHIILNGIFPKKPGIIIGMFDGEMISGFPSEVLDGFPNRKAIFKYPSWKYPGVLAD
jgi:hypothetical protein